MLEKLACGAAEILKEDDNLFLFFFPPKKNEKEKDLNILRETEIERFRYLVKLMLSMDNILAFERVVLRERTSKALRCMFSVHGVNCSYYLLEFEWD